MTIAEGRDRRDKAMNDVKMANTLWALHAEEVVLEMARTKTSFTTDDVWEYLSNSGVSAPPEPRVLGPVMMAMVRAGHIRPIGYAQCRRPSRHAGTVRVYASNVMTA